MPIFLRHCLVTALCKTCFMSFDGAHRVATMRHISTQLRSHKKCRICLLLKRGYSTTFHYTHRSAELNGISCAIDKTSREDSIPAAIEWLIVRPKRRVGAKYRFQNTMTRVTLRSSWASRVLSTINQFSLSIIRQIHVSSLEL